MLVKDYVKIEDIVRGDKIDRTEFIGLLSKFLDKEEIDEYLMFATESPMEFFSRFEPATYIQFAKEICENTGDYVEMIQIGKARVNNYKTKMILKKDNMFISDYFSLLGRNISLILNLAKQAPNPEHYNLSGRYIYENQEPITLLFGVNMRSFADSLFEEALEMEPNNKDILYSLAKIYAEDECFEKAINCYKQITNVHNKVSLEKTISHLESLELQKRKSAANLQRIFKSQNIDTKDYNHLEIALDRIDEILLDIRHSLKEKSSIVTWAGDIIEIPQNKYPLTLARSCISELNKLTKQINNQKQDSRAKSISLALVLYQKAIAYNALGNEEKEIKWLKKTKQNLPPDKASEICDMLIAQAYERRCKPKEALNFWLKAIKTKLKTKTSQLQKNSSDERLITDTFFIKIIQNTANADKEKKLIEYLSQQMSGKVPPLVYSTQINGNECLFMKKYKGRTLEEAILYAEMNIKDRSIVHEYKLLSVRNSLRSLAELQIKIKKEDLDVQIPEFKFSDSSLYISKSPMKNVKEGVDYLMNYLTALPRVFSHGDLHLGNILNLSFKNDNTKIPEYNHGSLIDFGKSCFANQCFDIAYLLEQYTLNFEYSDKLELIREFIASKGITGAKAENEILEEYDHTAAYLSMFAANIFSSGCKSQKYNEEDCCQRAKWYYSNACEALNRIMTRTPENMETLKPLYSVLQTECKKMEETGHL